MKKSQQKNSLFFITRGARVTTVLTIIVVLMEVIAIVLLPKITAQLTNQGLLNGNYRTPNMHAVYKYSGIIFALAIISLVLGTLGGVLANRSGAVVGRNLREDLFRKIQSFSFQNIDKISRGSLIVRLTEDIQNIEAAYITLIRMILRAPGMLIFAVVFAYLESVALANVLLILVLCLTFSISTIIYFAFAKFKRKMHAYDQLNNKIIENLNGIRTIKAFVKEDDEFVLFAKSSKIFKKYAINAEKLITYSQGIFSATIFIAMTLFIIIATNKMVFSNGKDLNFGVLVAFVAYMWQVFISLIMFAGSLVQLTIARTSFYRIKEVFNTHVTITNSANPIKNFKNLNIKFEDVSLKYDPALKQYSLKNINLEIKEGQTIGIIGPTGSGKTSLISLISRFYDVSQGQIKIGDINVKNYDLTALRNNISTILQKNVLFKGTVRENMQFGNLNATDEEINKALKIACAYDFIYEDPLNLDKIVEEDGNNFSGGQKQRLCIARAILKNSKIIIFDDSTSAVDNKTDKKIQNALEEELHKVTKIIVAQRLNSIQKADKIIVMNNGKIEAFDTPKNLFKTNKFYKELWKIQNGAQNDK